MLLLFLFVLFEVLPSLYYSHIVIINLFHGTLHVLFNQERLGSRSGGILGRVCARVTAGAISSARGAVASPMRLNINNAHPRGHAPSNVIVVSICFV